MDERKLSTRDFLSMGGTRRPVPTTDIPEDRERIEFSDCGNEAALREVLEAGKLVCASNYYGIPYVWRAASGVYRGVLLQYRAVTENPTFDTLDAAVAWFQETAGRTDG